MSELVHIAKHGEPTIAIHPAALAEHLKLGWRETDAPPAPKPAKVEADPADDAAKAAAAAAKAERAELFALLKDAGVEMPKNTTTDALRAKVEELTATKE